MKRETTHPVVMGDDCERTLQLVRETGADRRGGLDFAGPSRAGLLLLLLRTPPLPKGSSSSSSSIARRRGEHSRIREELDLTHRRQERGADVAE